MGAAIVLGDDLDVFMMVASVQLVFDAEVREVDRLVEVRQVVFVRPRFNLVSVPIRSDPTNSSFCRRIRLPEPP